VTLSDAQLKLADAYSLLDFSEKLLDDIESAPLSELPRLINLLKKNIRDVKNLINDAERLIDDTVKEIDREAYLHLVDMPEVVGE